MEEKSFINYQKGADHAGAKPMLEAEWDYLDKTRKGFDRNQIKGIALSGGGIRSASFCLGVLQKLAADGKLEKFDYLSTVSGGGYLGGSLSWLWSGLWKDKGSESPDFGVTAENFPYGTEVRQFNSEASEATDVRGAELDSRNKASLLRHLRQNGKYLTPGRGISALSLFSIVLRSIAMGFVTLTVFAATAFSALYFLNLIEANQPSSQFFRILAGASLAGYVLFQLYYMWDIAQSKKKQASGGAREGYRKRRWFESHLPYFLLAFGAVLLLASIHWVQAKLSLYMSTPEIGGLSAALGALLGSIGIDSRWRTALKWIPHSLQLVLAAAMVMFGLLVMADWLVVKLDSWNQWLHFPLLLALSYLLVWFARNLPINNISIHRYYRDRLMETFMPDAEKVLAGKEDGEALKANETGVHQLKRDEQSGETTRAPFHLINTNVILVKSEIAKFRGRGGDNFVLSPLYSGSNATGWRKTSEFCGGYITLPSAVAISGAAANPDAGVAGKGLTTNTIVSLLMSVFNLRLGYWAPNPNPEYQSDQRAMPSFFNPGFIEVLNRGKMNEEAEFVQLSDGGHFENLALYELFRRRARLIVVCDAAADPDYSFADLANAIEKARVDFGVKINFKRSELQRMVPASKPDQADRDYPVAETCYLVTPIDYNDGSGIESRLVYIKTTLANNFGADVHGYKRANPSFPDESTVDQFFDEVQFEAYRELGWQTARSMLSDKEVQSYL